MEIEMLPECWRFLQVDLQCYHQPSFVPVKIFCQHRTFSVTFRLTLYQENQCRPLSELSDSDRIRKLKSLPLLCLQQLSSRPQKLVTFHGLECVVYVWPRPPKGKSRCNALPNFHFDQQKHTKSQWTVFSSLTAYYEGYFYFVKNNGTWWKDFKCGHVWWNVANAW